MLTHLYIRDFVIVDQLDLTFSAGFGALTGETGAGKSILIDALSLVLGERADTQVIRPGASRADLAAEFELVPDKAAWRWLTDNGFEPAPLLLRRTVEAQGRSRCWINGIPVTAGQLRDLGTLLADIHGQHAHLSLLKTAAQRDTLDAHANLSALAEETAAHYHQWRQVRDARLSASADQEALERERDLLRFQVQELDALDFSTDRWAEENTQHKRLGHAAQLTEGLHIALSALDEQNPSALGLLNQAYARMAALLPFDPDLDGPARLIDEARIQIEEAVHALGRYRDHVDNDPQQLLALDARIDAVMTTARKHRVEPDALPDILARLNNRLEALMQHADPEALEAQESQAYRAWQKSASQLSAKRQEAAVHLGKQITAALQQLALAGSRFHIALTPRNEPSAFGMEDIEFLVSANAGQPPRPLAKVASGGELSRIGLAIQVIASQATEAETLIFDEVDAGIGGGVAEMVGRHLRALGEHRQTLCVTHLPQAAACAHWQWRIAKSQKDGITRSQVEALEQAARIEEIARMLGGVKITPTTRQHATEMLAAAASGQMFPVP
jgi:DNA repair protein RecN (Recombination protein N)